MEASSRLRDTCLLVRTHAPTDAQIARVAAWQQSVIALGGQLWVSGGPIRVDAAESLTRGCEIAVDATAEAGRVAVERFKLAGVVQVHAYDEATMLGTYPILFQMGPKMAAVTSTSDPCVALIGAVKSAPEHGAAMAGNGQ